MVGSGIGEPDFKETAEAVLGRGVRTGLASNMFSE